MRRIGSNNPLRLALTSAAVLFCAGTMARAGNNRILFNRDVRPIFSDTCFRCHGFAKSSRKANLRLDDPADAFVKHENGVPIVPGHPEQSEAYRRLMSNDPDELMPPPKSNLSLSAEQKETIRKWIEQGARYEAPWAFTPLSAPEVPQVGSSSWGNNEIDRFVLAELQSRGLSPSPEADRATLIRRLAFDLTGLPPTPSEIDAFCADTSPDWYEKQVDRYLASPRYGERMATIWLDAARFADTHGFQADRERAMWPYRDWVIEALNRDMPFDQFATWQLAGDLLPNATKEQRLATAFDRLHMQNEEGGIIPEEYRVAYVNDRVTTFATTFLGLTFECSRCHDHKYDPITQRDFYSLFAFFQNIDESGQSSYFTDPLSVPTLLLSSDETEKKLASLSQQITDAERQLAQTRSSATKDFDAWLTTRGKRPLALPGLVAAYSFDAIDDKAKTPNSVNPAQKGVAVDGPRLVAGRFGKGAQLSGDNGFEFPGVGHFTRSDPFSMSIWIKADAITPRQVVLHLSRGAADAGSRGYELLLEDGHVALGLHHMWPGNSLKVRTRQTVSARQWVSIVATYDGSSRAAGTRIYLDGQPAELEVIRDNLYKDIIYGAREPDLAVGYRFRDNGFKDGTVDELKVFNRVVTPIEAADLAGREDFSAAWATEPASLNSDQRQSLLDYYLSAVSTSVGEQLDALQKLRREQATTVEAVPEVMVMQELPTPKPAYILKRGAYDQHGDEVHANTPAVLPPLAANEPRNRLGLAHWLFSSSNPLTARVTTNRLWQQMLGHGIVATCDNFGSQGSPPTHPELLDWLASDFETHGWDIKRTLKEIAMSATYRQSSKASPDALASDPDNRWLARGPSRRLTAEMIRDQGLADGGLLVEKIGGPSVRPYQPDGVWDVAAGHPVYGHAHGDELHRRSLYTFWKRTAPPPMMVAFDAPDRNYCVVRRQSTSTPLQALTLLNDEEFTEDARFIAQRMLKEGGEKDSARIAWAFQLCTSRKPTPTEMGILLKLYAEQVSIYTGDVESAKKLLAVGETRNDPSLDPVQLAAETVLAEALLNYDPSVMCR